MNKKMIIMITAFLLILSVLPVNAENGASELSSESMESDTSRVQLSTEGTAYAVLTDKKELVFFRSFEEYTDKSTGVFTDINKNEYSGKVYTDIETLNLSDTGNANTAIPWYEDRDFVYSARVAANQAIKPVNMSQWFRGCYNMTNISLIGFDTSGVNNMNSMFAGCTSLTDLNLGVIDTGSVTNMRGMFSECSNLMNLDLQGVNTSNRMKNTEQQIIFQEFESLNKRTVGDIIVNSIHFNDRGIGIIFQEIFTISLGSAFQIGFILSG